MRRCYSRSRPQYCYRHSANEILMSQGARKNYAAWIKLWCFSKAAPPSNILKPSHYLRQGFGQRCSMTSSTTIESDRHRTRLIYYNPATSLCVEDMPSFRYQGKVSRDSLHVIFNLAVVVRIDNRGRPPAFRKSPRLKCIHWRKTTWIWIE